MTEEQIVRLFKNLRTRSGFTQGDVAAAAGVSRETITHLESGRSRLRYSQMLEYAGVLGYEVYIEVVKKTDWSNILDEVGHEPAEQATLLKVIRKIQKELTPRKMKRLRKVASLSDMEMEHFELLIDCYIQSSPSKRKALVKLANRLSPAGPIK